MNFVLQGRTVLLLVLMILTIASSVQLGGTESKKERITNTTVMIGKPEEDSFF